VCCLRRPRPEPQHLAGMPAFASLVRSSLPADVRRSRLLVRGQAKVFKGEGDEAKSFIRDAQVCMASWARRV